MVLCSSNLVLEVWVYFLFFPFICIPDKFIYLLCEKEGEAGPGAKPKTQSSTTYYKGRHPEQRSCFSWRPPHVLLYDLGRAPRE